MSEQDSVQPKTRRRHRPHRHRRPQKALRASWIVRNGLDILFTILLVVALLMVFIPLAGLLSGLQVQNRSAIWLLDEGGMSIVGGMLLVLIVLFGSLRLRQRINNHQPWWARGCPECGSTNLSRIHRNAFDRLLGRMGIPMRRYICRECHWQGGRIDETRV